MNKLGYFRGTMKKVLAPLTICKFSRVLVIITDAKESYWMRNQALAVHSHSIMLFNWAHFSFLGRDAVEVDLIREASKVPCLVFSARRGQTSQQVGDHPQVHDPIARRRRRWG